ncbi:MAG: F0F1 ATP synthase subunit alpha, partial [Proteobacteria bacterium]|nr:F0F1 ATP synthase subunit alpha [Pseudomonadota bacterium]
VDALFPIGRGQRQLLIGDRGTGKSAVALDAVINQRTSGVKCVYAMIGQKASSVVATIATLKKHDALGHTVVLVAGADSPAGLRYLAPYAACSIAEYFRDQGQDALVVFDDLTSHAIAYRELSLLLRRPPGREAYPGDIFFVHSRLLERATHLSEALGGGSLTALPIVETQAGRISDFIPTNLISITDGQLVFDAMAFHRNLKPAIDVGLSVSRVGGRTQLASMRAVAGRLRLDSARFREVEAFSRFGARLEEGTQKLLVRGARIREVLRQPPAAPLPLGEQVAVLLALESGLFDAVEPGKVREQVRKLRQHLRQRHPELLLAFEHGRAPSEEDRAAVAASHAELGT